MAEGGYDDKPEFTDDPSTVFNFPVDANEAGDDGLDLPLLGAARARSGSLQGNPDELFDQTFTPLSPESPEKVVEDTEPIIKTFLCQRYEQERRSEPESTPKTDAFDELEPPKPFEGRKPVQIGAKLAELGDKVDQEYGAQIQELVAALNPSPETAGEAFQVISSRFLHMGKGAEITWGKIATMLQVAWHMIKHVCWSHVGEIRSFLSTMVSSLVNAVKDFFASWIASHGGWIAILKLAIRSASSSQPRRFSLGEGPSTQVDSGAIELSGQEPPSILVTADDRNEPGSPSSSTSLPDQSSMPPFSSSESTASSQPSSVITTPAGGSSWPKVFLALALSGALAAVAFGIWKKFNGNGGG